VNAATNNEADKELIKQGRLVTCTNVLITSGCHEPIFKPLGISIIIMMTIIMIIIMIIYPIYQAIVSSNCWHLEWSRIRDDLFGPYR